MSWRRTVLALLPLAAAAPASAQVDARMLRHPAVSQSQIAFVYAGDIWVVPKSGGVAQRLSTPRGEEQFPRFSPDGTMIGYSASYDGNLDVYVVPAAGGTPTRITHNPAVMGGKPCIRGLRVTVGTILGLLASGKSRERILQAYPYLESEDIDAALAYAAWRLEERDEPPVFA